MSSSGVSLLEIAQPIHGYKTVAALATSYSADLIACLALLIALDGGDGESVSYSKIDALRALERLRENVRIVVQQNRIEYHEANARGVSSKLFGLFDSIIRTIPFDGRERSFHPKVLLTRQKADDLPDRYILTVGSRNLTTSSAWDFGIGLVGLADGRRRASTCQISELDPFVEALGSLTEEPGLLKKFGSLGDVNWGLPPGVKKLSFHFRSGTQRNFDNSELSKLQKRGRALLISPFLTPTLVRHMADHFAAADDIRLVSGKAFLDQLASTRVASNLSSSGGSVHAFSMAIASDNAQPEALNVQDPEEREPERGLHAKVFCVSSEDSTTAIIGSANLTNHAWLGGNWEAFLTLKGTDQLANELWDWSNMWAHPYRPPENLETLEAENDQLDDLRNDLAKREFQLNDFSEKNSTLFCDGISALLRLHKCALEVARFTNSTAWIPWNKSSDLSSLPPCHPSERTAFLLIRAIKDDRDITWVQTSKLTPPVDSDRDKQAFVRLLGVQDFLRYLKALLDGSTSPEGEIDISGRGGANGHDTRRSDPEDLFRLEDLLRRLNKDPRALIELNVTVQRHRDLFERNITDQDDRDRFEQFISLWSAISDGMAMS